MDLASWNAQLRKGAVELAVLAALETDQRYGLEILERVNRLEELVSDGAIYPLLSRLEKEGKLTPRWALDEGPHPRKYYGLTTEGRRALSAMTRSWSAFRTAMDDIVEGDR